MWEVLTLIAGCLLGCSVVFVTFIRIFLMKSSRDAPVLRPAPHRPETNDKGETCKWLEDPAKQLLQLYFSQLSPAQLRAFFQGHFTKLVASIGGRVCLHELELGTVLPKVTIVQQRTSDDSLELTANIEYGCIAPDDKDFKAVFTVECPALVPRIGSALLPVEVSIVSPRVFLQVKVVWHISDHLTRLVQGHSASLFSHFEVSLQQPAAVSGHMHTKIGISPKTIDTPFLASIVCSNLRRVVDSIVHPNGFQWSVPLPGFSVPSGRREEGRSTTTSPRSGSTGRLFPTAPSRTGSGVHIQNGVRRASAVRRRKRQMSGHTSDR
eukprot:Sspe_Gene.74845::Locus_46770_Transcript_1_1_Confidence_1.000_Length_1049::g.74845::m.74845